MKKLSLIITLLLAVLLLQECKKDTFTETATSSNTLFAVINDTTWSGDTITAAMVYNSATKTKVLTCTGIAKNKEVNFMVTQPNAYNTAGFPLSVFNADVAGTITFSYYTSTTGNNFVEQGTVAPGSGTIDFTAIDSVKRQVSGTFSYLSEKNNYDQNGNIISVTINEVQDGAFNNLPYTFTSN